MRAIERVVMTVMALLTGAGLSLAQQPAGAGANDGFVPMSQLPAAEQLPAAPMVIGAYAFIWAAMLVYVFLLWRRLAAVDRDIAALRKAIDGQP